MNTYGFVPESDSSLPSYSCEFVSNIYDLENKKTFFKKAKKLFADFLSEHKPSVSFGGHIHVSVEGIKPAQLYDMLFPYLPLFFGMYPSRAKHSYCHALNNQGLITEPKITQQEIKVRHRSPLCATPKTVEVRIFPSPTTVEQIKFRLRLLEVMLKHKVKNWQEVVKLINDKNSKLGRTIRSVYKGEERIQTLLNNCTLQAKTYKFWDSQKLKATGSAKEYGSERIFRFEKENELMEGLQLEQLEQY